MNIIIISNYYYPELGAAPSRITNLAEGLTDKEHKVNVICPIPNYPKGQIFEGYKGKLIKHEEKNNVSIHRFWIYPSVSKNPVIRIISMFSFALSLWLFGFKRKTILNTDVVIVQNSPLLVSMSAIILFKKIFNRKLALNVSDLWPLSALELGAVKKGRFYSFLEWVERFNYRNSDLIMGQSQEILEHVQQIEKKTDFLYRNVPLSKNRVKQQQGFDKFKIVYAGLLGVAQGVYELVKKINFKTLNVEMHIYGHGNEKEEIETYIRENRNTNIFYHGSLPKELLFKILPDFQASIVPLKNRIHGAVPSKIFELSSMGIPILFCGGGEGAKIVEQYKLGFSSEPGNFLLLTENIKKMRCLKEEDYLRLKENCISASETSFDFNKQLDLLIDTINNTLINEKSK
jgi:glycosyltransferase involved in cell wall biosynthesis